MQGVYVHTQKNVLFKVLPSTRLPRTFKRFCGLMGKIPVLQPAAQLFAETRVPAPQCNCCRS